MRVMVIKIETNPEYPNKIESYLRNIIINFQNSDAWKIQLTIAIEFISSKDIEEARVMPSSSVNIKFTPHSDANEIVNKLFKSLRSRCKENLETSMKGSNFFIDSVEMIYYKCHKVNFRSGGSYIDSPYWIKNKEQE